MGSRDHSVSSVPSSRSERDSRPTNGAGNDETEPAGKTGNSVSRRPSRQVNSGVRYYNFQGFYNRVEDDNWDYTIEALVARPVWAEDVNEEQARRSAISEGKLDDAVSHTIGVPMIFPPEKLGEGRKIQRVRIRSPTVLKLLAEISLWDDSSLLNEDNEEIVFGRPFRTFEYCHDGMKKKLAEMEVAEAEKTSKKGRSAEATDTPGAKAPVSELKIIDAPAEDPEVQRGVDAATPPRSTPLEDLRVFVAFVENSILPIWERFGRAEKGYLPKILYTEIPCLFKPGDLVYVAPPAKMSRGLYPSAVQTIFKVIYCVPRDLTHEFKNGKWDHGSLTETSVRLHCLDYDGESFKAIYHVVEFNDSFDDEREITSLPCYPLRFHPDYEALLKRHTEMGEWFRKCVEGGIRHLYYSGWTLVTSMLPGDDKEEPRMKEVGTDKEPSYIESDVVVDFKEATRHIPDWKTSDPPSFNAGCRGERDLACQMSYWPKNGGQHVHRYSEVFLVREDNIHSMDAVEFFKNDRWLQGKKLVDSTDWDPIDLAILPRRILGYVVRERKFARLDVQNFHHQRQGRQTTLDDIKMKDGHRNIIRSTVSSHFDKKEKEHNSIVPEYQPDVIQGKGKGVVILLHGAPGVGKTATAEAVAQEYKKPLFPITCGDLGTTPEVVENTLKNIFRYAHLWDCVLLLDEADVFLTQRDRTDVERNALVSVFLRVLEYYSGILFLTTNRVGALDEAFRSRIHVSLYYPHLSRGDTLAILKDNLNRLPRVEDVAEGEVAGPGHIQIQDKEIEEFVTSEFNRCYEKHNRGPWNGRQIRNAVQIASCLAFYEVQSKPQSKNVRAVLTATHFKTVAETTAEFDRYLREARRGDEAKLAHMHGDRFDGFDDQDHDDHDSHAPVEFEPMFPTRSPRGRGAGAPGPQGGRRSAGPQSASRQFHSPKVRSPNARSNQYSTPRRQRYADDDDLSHGALSDRRPTYRSYRSRTAEDDGDFGEYDHPEADYREPSGDSMDGRDVRGKRDRDVRMLAMSGDSREYRSNRPVQTGYSSRQANGSTPRRGADSHDEDEGHEPSPYHDRPRRGWEHEDDTHKPIALGDLPRKGSERRR
ncbi:Fidgetin-like protein 1 [Madurella mycetomatis]|uniref:Fidgetin-like protein 1 n=1 Tax=Madurella mycetomatis TaxID=100816 RepID=A0A175W5T6_9PEZI|nr:Fidgetin-like protein 1 [Madurella mycetomatis]